MLPDVQSYDMSFYIKQFKLQFIIVTPSFANGGNLFVLPIDKTFTMHYITNSKFLGTYDLGSYVFP